MSAIRLPLLCAFVGGCLSSAVVFGLWQADPKPAAPAPKQAMRKVEVVAPARALTNAQPRSEAIVDRVVEPGPSAPAEAALALEAKSTQDVESNNAAVPAGSAVSDVLTRLEAEYRERVAAAAPAPSAAPAAVVPASTRVPVAVAPTALAQVAAIAPAAAIAPVVAITPAPAAPAPVAPVAIATQVPVAQPAVVQAAVAAAPAYAAQNDPRTRDVHIGDVTQNTYITNVRQGDVYLMQMQQQIAMLQYMQLLGMQAAGGAVAPMRQVRAVAPQRFTSGITNPDNPWGFNFAPPNLVR